VNDRIERLNAPLKSGDVVEIIVDKSRKGPNPDWLKSVKTRYARSKIRQQAQASIKSWIKGFVHGEDA
jgi:guanosine-3',5'-bis(diphosphate) 3'-pyrophosphohydrolase